MTDKTAKLQGDMDEKATVKLTLTPDGLYPSYQFIEFRTKKLAEDYVSVANGKCDEAGDIEYHAEIVQSVTVRRADRLDTEIRYLRMHDSDYDDARMLLGDVIPARPGMVGWRFHAKKNRVVKTGRDEYKVVIPNGMDYTLKAVGEEEEDGAKLTKYQLIGYGGDVVWEARWSKGEVPKGLLESIGQ